MAKTLSESAAEILRASMAANNKEPMMSLGADMQDLGGATPEDDYSGGPWQGQKDVDKSVGVDAAKAATQAVKPGLPGVPAEPKKIYPGSDVKIGQDGALEINSLEVSAADAEDEGEMEDGGTQSPEETRAKALLKPGQKIGAMNIAEESEDDEDDEDGEDGEEVNEESFMEGMKKDLIAKYRGSMREDVDALFNGESLSEDFRVKATLIFESAVQSRVEQIVDEVVSENDKVLDAAIGEIKTELSEQVDEYLNYVVEEWVKENEIAIETGLRAELAEDFINGLKNLFVEHYMEIPEEKVNVTEELATRVVELEEAIASKATEKESILSELKKIKKAKAIDSMCEGLTAVQAGKLKSLAEGVEFTTDGDFDNKLAVLRENYFPNKTNVKSEVKVLQERTIEAPEVAEVTNSIMARYVQSISKTAPKA